MGKKQVEIKFVDFGKNTFREDLIIRILSKRYDVVLSEKPDYLFYSVFSDSHLKYENSVRIFVTTENLSPDFNMCDYGIGYEFMEYGDRYLRFPIYCFDGYSEMFKKCLIKHQNIDQGVLKEKTDFCSFVYSNADADPFRIDLFEAINRYRDVDSGGRYMNNIGRPEGVVDKLQFQYAHKFSIACENSSHAGYTTEKLVEAFAAKTIPIYWGDPVVERVFNERAFINAFRYESLDELVSEIERIDGDDDAYLEMLRQPAVLCETDMHNQMVSNLERFLFSIIDQPLEHAYRRNRVFWGMAYYQKQKRWKRAFDILTLNASNYQIKKVRTALARLVLRIKR